jgi:predicted transcriptional regulator
MRPVRDMSARRRASAAATPDLGVLRVCDVMSKRIVDVRRERPVIDADDCVREAVRVMLDAAVDAVTVVDAHGVPVGVLTWSDILRLVAGPPG